MATKQNCKYLTSARNMILRCVTSLTLNCSRCLYLIFILIVQDASDPSEMSCAWSDGFVLVYSITDAASLTTAIELKREIDQKRKFRSTHFILVGNKSDLVQHRRVSEKDGRSAAESLGCCFTEASARDNVAVEDAFEKAVKTMGPTSRRNSIIGVMTPSSETRKKKIPFLSKAKAKLGHTSPIALAMGLGGKRMSQPETQPLTIKTIASMRRASVA